MRVPPLSDLPKFAGATRWWRWAVVVLLSLLLHLAALNWAGGNLGLFSWKNHTPPVLHTQLIRLPVPKAAAPAAPPTARPKPRPVRPKPQARPPAPVVAAPALDTPAPVANQSAAPPPAPVMPEGMDFGGPDIASIDPLPVLGATSIQSAQAADGTRYKVDPPPSAELEYDVSALREGQMVYGHGTIGWTFNGEAYQINGEAGVLFISVLSFSSQGHTDDFGIAPAMYTEKRFRRPATNTRFDRDRNLISFSASTNSYPLQGGEQDRASIIWQLAGIGRGDPARFVADATIPLFIAGARDGEPWQIRVIGEEEIEVGTGKLQAWHVQRAPRAGTREQQLDFWLAPGQQWYPVKLRFTEVNGEYLDMSLSDIQPIADR